MRWAGHIACMEKWEICTKFWLENLNGSGKSKDLSVDPLIILKLIVRKYCERMWAGLVWHRTGTDDGFQKTKQTFEYLRRLISFSTGKLLHDISTNICSSTESNWWNTSFEESCFWTLSIVQCFFFKNQRFGSWLCFRLQVKKEGRGSWVQWLRLALSKGPHRVGATPPFLPEDGSTASFRNAVF
jgi:hypothetical protein